MKALIKRFLNLFGYGSSDRAKDPGFFPDVPGKRPTSTLQKCVDVVRIARNQMSNIEYGILIGMVARHKPANLLVFGLGRDSELWAELNRGGRTVFLENLEEWMRPVAGAEVFKVVYPNLELPATVTNLRWDIVIVDSPMGFRPEDPGRGESIAAAASLTDKGSIVAVHDYDRDREQQFSQQYLGDPSLVIDRIAIYFR